MRKYLSFILLLIGLTLQAQETYKTVKDISYIPAGETDGYRKERCKLDVYYPVGKKDFPTSSGFMAVDWREEESMFPRCL